MGAMTRAGLPGSLKKNEKKLLEKVSKPKKSRNADYIHGQGIYHFRARQTATMHIVALKRKSQSINSLPHYSRNEI